MKLQQKLAGPRVAIRNYEKSDLNFVTGMWLDEENGRYLSDPTAAYVDERFQRALDTLQDEQDGGYFIIETADTAQRIGSCSAFPGETAGEYDIGYCIHKAHWRRGYGREAVALLLDWLRAQGGAEDHGRSSGGKQSVLCAAALAGLSGGKEIFVPEVPDGCVLRQRDLCAVARKAAGSVNRNGGMRRARADLPHPLLSHRVLWHNRENCGIAAPNRKGGLCHGSERIKNR